ncbi:transcriptional regulator [Sorangium sp. So ce1000]|uniref:transcriptional regulator n=1 Tax=Sorangium sp. So ce1000 TaxID=3133325 RepID=UPI003F5F94C1
MQLLLPPPTGGQGEGAPKRRRLCVTRSLSEVERKRLRAALRNLRTAYGSWSCVGEIMGMRARTLRAIVAGTYAGSPCTAMRAARAARAAMRAARAAGTTVERLLGRPVAADKCPSCWRSG